MNSELKYLLHELYNWDSDKSIQVKDLKKMIEKSFKQAERDQKVIDNSLKDIEH